MCQVVEHVAEGVGLPRLDGDEVAGKDDDVGLLLQDGLAQLGIESMPLDGVEPIQMHVGQLGNAEPVKGIGHVRRDDIDVLYLQLVACVPMSDDGGNGNDQNQRAEEDPMDDACHVFGHEDAGQDDDAVEKKTHDVVRELIIYMAKGHFVSLMVLRTLKAFGAKQQEGRK